MARRYLVIGGRALGNWQSAMIERERAEPNETPSGLPGLHLGGKYGTVFPLERILNAKRLVELGQARVVEVDAESGGAVLLEPEPVPRADLEKGIIDVDVEAEAKDPNVRTIDVPLRTLGERDAE